MCNKMVSDHRALLPHTEIQELSSRNVPVLELWAKLAALFMEDHFTLKNNRSTMGIQTWVSVRHFH